MAESSQQPAAAPSGTTTTQTTSSSSANDEFELTEFAESLWFVDGPDVNFFGFPYPTRMVVAKVRPPQSTGSTTTSTSSGGSWVWSPTRCTPALAKAMEDATGGPVLYIVSPNMIHHIFLREWQDAYPDAKLYAPPGLAERKKVLPPGLRIDGILSDNHHHDDTDNEQPPTPPPPYGEEIDQVVFAGGGLEEVVFFHKRSRTAILCDLIQRHVPDKCCGWKGWLMKVDGLVGPQGSTPREWRLLYRLKGGLPRARTALSIIVHDWKPDKLIIAHGECATTNATEIIQTALSWMQ